VQVAAAGSGIGIRDSENLHHPVLVFSRDGMAAFQLGLKDDELGGIG
jgi:hypothetical protein